MLDGRTLIDVHLHPAPRSSLKIDWATWVQDFDSPAVRGVYRDDGTVDAVRFDDLLSAEGVDAAVALKVHPVHGGFPVNHRALYPAHYAQRNWPRLTRKMIFGTDWPGIPGIAINARGVAALCPDDDTAALVLAGNAQRVYGLVPVSG